jgi:DNA-directed RNA polymerase subunit RPC12/RpoP
MKNYQCKKCRTLIKKDSSPATVNCPEGGFHQWTNLGDVGPNNYQCRKCSALVETKNTPSTVNCPDGGFHQWTKL